MGPPDRPLPSGACAHPHRLSVSDCGPRTKDDGLRQGVGFAKLKALGTTLIAADSPQSFLDDTPTSKLIRLSEFDKAMVVAKLKGARERKRALTGKKVEGRKSHAELRPELVALVRQLRRKRPKGGQRSLGTSQRSLPLADISTSVACRSRRRRSARCCSSENSA